MKFNEFKVYVKWFKENVPYMEKWEIYKIRDILYSSNKFNTFIKDSIWEYVWQDVDYDELMARYINNVLKLKNK